MLGRLVSYLGRHHLALLALFLALGGTSYAAIRLPANSVGSKQLKRGAVTPRKVARSTIKLFKGQKGVRGPIGPTGVQGPKGATGAAGTYPTTLPSGQTEQGVFAGESDDAGNPSAHTYAAAAFSIPLASAPTAHIIQMGGAPTADCPGSSTNPTATAGNLCIYVTNASGTNVSVFDPANPSSTTHSSRWGTTLSIISSGGCWLYGTWAVKAP